MILNAAAAKALAAVMLCSMLGPKELQARLPFDAALSGSNWIVRGRSGPISGAKEVRGGFYVYIDRATAEVHDLATMDFKSSKETRQAFRKAGWKPLRKTVLGLPPTPNASGVPPDLIQVLYGGVVSTPKAAIEYARVLMGSKPSHAKVQDGVLRAEERDHVWHVMMKPVGSATEVEVLSFSRINGKVLSGDL